MKHACLPVGYFPTHWKVYLAGLSDPRVNHSDHQRRLVKVEQPSAMLSARCALLCVNRQGLPNRINLYVLRKLVWESYFYPEANGAPGVGRFRKNFLNMMSPGSTRPKPSAPTTIYLGRFHLGRFHERPRGLLFNQGPPIPGI
jgi:hypothetical protein